LSHAHSPLVLAAAVSVCADQQFGANSHRICEAQTLGNSLNVGLRADYLSVHMAGGTSDRRLTEGTPYKWTYLITYVLHK